GDQAFHRVRQFFAAVIARRLFGERAGLDQRLGGRHFVDFNCQTNPASLLPPAQRSHMDGGSSPMPPVRARRDGDSAAHGADCFSSAESSAVASRALAEAKVSAAFCNLKRNRQERSQSSCLAQCTHSGGSGPSTWVGKN